VRVYLVYVDDRLCAQAPYSYGAYQQVVSVQHPSTHGGGGNARTTTNRGVTAITQPGGGGGGGGGVAVGTSADGVTSNGVSVVQGALSGTSIAHALPVVAYVGIALGLLCCIVLCAAGAFFAVRAAMQPKASQDSLYAVNPIAQQQQAYAPQYATQQQYAQPQYSLNAPQYALQTQPSTQQYALHQASQQYGSASTRYAPQQYALPLQSMSAADDNTVLFSARQ
jgi:hypothetical protein